MSLARAISRLVHRPAVFGGAAAGCMLTVIWIIFGVGVNSSGGSAWLVILPIAAGAAFLAAATSWFSGIEAATVGPRCDSCGNCGYDQRGLPSATTRCPECGADPEATGPYQTRWRWVLAIPAWCMMLLGVFCVIITAFYLLLWQSGALGDR